MRQQIPFGKYLLLERINVGGMAEIFLARSRGVHGFKRFAYISGPTTNAEANIRLRAFKDVLRERGLELPTALLVEGDFTEVSGEAAIAAWVDRRKVDVRGLDAIVAANDSMAFGAMEALKQRGVSVPEDLSIVGFDDVEAARYADMPLTTVQQPLTFT